MDAPQQSVAVVGGGLAGVACARALGESGVPAVVLERAHRLGGRMASPRVHERPVDTGAAYFTVSDPGFAAVVADWEARGLALPWTDTLGVHSPQGRTTKTGPVRWRAPGGLRSLVADLGAGLDVRTEHPVVSVTELAAHPAVVLAMPDPQAQRLLSPGPARDQVQDRVWEPVIAVAVGVAQRSWDPMTATFVNDHPALALVADDGVRRGDDAPVLLAHTTTELAAAHLDDPEAVRGPVLAALEEVLGTELEVRWSHVHRWSFARPAAGRDVTHWLGDGIGLCGDGWGRSKVEAAWRSGVDLAAALAG